MRLWSLHPQYLDTKGLLAVWREGLLAKHVLEGKTKGYKNHPQLIRFKKTENPIAAINIYLKEILEESKRRNYVFNDKKIDIFTFIEKIPVTDKQISYEWQHLKNKFTTRNSEKLKNLPKKPKIHPMFREIIGEIENWEKV